MPSRNEAIAALLAAQSKPVAKTESEASDTRGTRAGMVGQVEFGGRVRDRISAQEQVVEQDTPRLDIWEESVARQRAKVLEEASRRKARREQEKDLERKRRWKIENDARVRRESQERRDKQIADDFIRAEIRDIVMSNDLNADELNQVLALVKSWKTEKLPLAWQTAIDQIRAQKSK